jgi:hypothetical protein
MIKKLKLSRVLSLSLLAGGIMLVGGLTDAAAQQVKGGRDPFEKPGYARPKPVVTPKLGKDGKPIPVEDFSVPSIEQRIDYYKRVRASAAASGAVIPKVTSVLSINEMALIGIFKTPRGYAAMVEATPIKLSYTIYPGEKFFDGQHVAVEDNQLVFRKVAKTGKNKFVSSVQNMQLRKYTERQELEGTAPSQSQTVASTETPSSSPSDKPVAPVKIVSPLDEMNSQPAGSAEKNSKAPAKKIAKIARNK